MKNKIETICLITLLVLGLNVMPSCFSDKSSDKGHGHSHGQGHKHGEANAHLEKKSMEELVAAFEGPDRDKWQKPYVVMNMMGDLEGKTVADIGAGTGYFAFKMAKLGAKVIAIDVDKRFIQYMDMKHLMIDKSIQANFETRLVEYDDPHLKANEVDKILIVNTYHHIEDRISYMQSLQKTLKPGGQIIIVDYKDEKTPHGPPMKLRLSAKAVQKELKKAGYQGVSVEETILPYQYIVFAE